MDRYNLKIYFLIFLYVCYFLYIGVFLIINELRNENLKDIRMIGMNELWK